MLRAQLVLVGGWGRASYRSSNVLGAGAALDGGASSTWGDSSCAARGALDWGSTFAGRARGRQRSLLGGFGTEGAKVEAERGLNRRRSGR